MKMEDIVSSWDKDSSIDETELGTESGKIPNLHAKYMRMLMAERSLLYKRQAELSKAKKVIYEFFNGELDENELKELGRDQFYKKMKTKEELQLYIDADDLIVDKRLLRNLQQEKVDYIERVLKQIDARNWQIKNMIEWLRFTSGG